MHHRLTGKFRGGVVYLLILQTVFILLACSSGKIKELNLVEIARQILVEQQNNTANQEEHPIKLNYVVSNKPVIGMETEIEIEVVSENELPYVTLAFETTANLRFKKKWLLLNQEIITKGLGAIKADTLYRYKVVVVPEKEGPLYLNVYAIYELKHEKRVKKLTIEFFIGRTLSTGVK